MTIDRKRIFEIVLLVFIISSGRLFSQLAPTSYVTRDFVESKVKFLSDDLLEGRKTGTRGNAIAALYIAESFRTMGLKPALSLGGYYQKIGFSETSPPQEIDLSIDEVTISEEQVIVMEGKDINFDGQIIYAKQAWGADLDDLDVEGKYALAYLGNSDVNNAQDAFGLSSDKLNQLMERQAAGLIEIYNGRVPWNYVKRFMDSQRMKIEDISAQNLPHIIVNHDLDETIEKMKPGEGVRLRLQSDGIDKKTVVSPNVIGIIEGSDADLKQEYIVLSAHFDHMGMLRGASETDSVFNGARDNAIGCAALLSAANYLAKNRPKRSILCVAFTGEEMGLLGSQYYVNHPVVPLHQTIFNLNCDGAGYSDTSIISVMGMGRISVDHLLAYAISETGLAPFADPAPEQNLFDRSDNVSFAKKGIPAPTITPGFKEFDDAIMKNYHQLSDEANDLDFNYLHKFCQAFVKATELIANHDERPKWVAGDKYESAFNELYEIK
ncbi:MAG: M28 family peptidase [Saprospiraceae bacterium]|nr:M28 family peptidase [Saprospiraceae bacterium]